MAHHVKKDADEKHVGIRPHTNAGEKNVSFEHDQNWAAEEWKESVRMIQDPTRHCLCVAFVLAQMSSH